MERTINQQAWNAQQRISGIIAEAIRNGERDASDAVDAISALSESVREALRVRVGAESADAMAIISAISAQ